MAGDPLIYRTVGEIAARDGISKQAVSKTLKRLLETDDIPLERDGRGRVVNVSLAHYDHARERLTNPAKSPVRTGEEPPPATPGSPVLQSESFDEARRVGEWLKVTRERLRHQEELRQLVRADVIAEAMMIAGREMKAIIMRLPNRADDIALAVSKEGQFGARTLLRAIAFELTEQIANRMGEIEAAAPAGDEMIEDPA